MADDLKYAELLRSISFRPMFVIGDHRSGTTLLYQMMASTGSFHVLTAYHIIDYDEIVTCHFEGRTESAKQLLRERFARLKLTDRVLDNIEVSPDLPEEYRFIIEDSARPMLRPANLERFVEMCQKLRLIGNSDKPILLKNPWDCLNFVFLYRSFPEAKFIFLQRNPCAVIDSQLRATQSMFAGRNEYLAMLSRSYAQLFQSRWKRTLTNLCASRLPVWDYLVPRHVIRASRYFVENISILPKESYFQLRYEDLCQSPAKVMQTLLNFLGVVPENTIDFEKLIAPRAKPGRTLRARTVRRLGLTWNIMAILRFKKAFATLRYFVWLFLFLTCTRPSFAQTVSLDAAGIATVLRFGGRVDWSPQNVITYDQIGDDGYFDVFVMNPDGSSQRCITCTSPNVPTRHKGNPVWHPSGNWIVFQAEKQSAPQTAITDRFASPGSGLNNDLWITDPQGQNFFQLTDVPLTVGGVLHPHFSHRGDRLLWAQRVSSAGGLSGTWALIVADFVVDSTGVPSLRNPRILQPGQQHSFYESHGFSLDDRQIYFSGNLEADQSMSGIDLYRYDLSTGALINLTNSPTEWDEHAQLSPDGSKILWISNRDQPSTTSLLTDYWIMNSDGSGKRRLTWFNRAGHPEYSSTPVAAGDSAWKPDSTGFLGYVNTDQFGNAGPLLAISIIVPAATVSAATFQNPILAPESIGSLFGRNLNVGTTNASQIPLPTQLDQTQVRITDSTGFGDFTPLIFAAPNQINYIVPARMAFGPATVEVFREGALVASGPITINRVVPGLFSANQRGQGPAAGQAVVVHPDGSRAEQQLAQCDANACVPIPIASGSQDLLVLVLYGIGIRGRSTLSSVGATIGGVQAQVLYAGAQADFVGLDQINILIPRSLAGAGTVDVVLTVDGIPANTLQVSLR